MKNYSKDFTCTESDLLSVYNRITDAVLSVDKNYVINYVNDAVVRLFPDFKESFVGKSV